MLRSWKILESIYMELQEKIFQAMESPGTLVVVLENPWNGQKNCFAIFQK